MTRALSRRKRHKEEPELNVTAFMNLMVVLVPFLLITAVFSRLTILQLNLPGDSSGAAEDPPAALNLEIIVHQDRIEVADRRTGPLKMLPNQTGTHDLKGLGRYLQTVKARYPEKTDATVLLLPDTSYDVVVQIMDTVRAYTAQQGGKFVQGELFPDISIGDAPVIADPPQDAAT